MTKQHDSSKKPVNRYATLKQDNPDRIDLYEKREKIHPKSVKGFWENVRVWTVWITMSIYVLLPWLNWNGKQAILFDLPGRKFHIFSITFWPQDFLLLSWLLIIAAFSLFVATALFGRAWCGFYCPQTVWTRFFMWIEEWTEGDRLQRKKLDNLPWSFDKIRKRVAKHTLWLALAFITGFTFIGYFSPVRELVGEYLNFSLGPWQMFWGLFFTAATYTNAGWMREQVCLHMCPYARFQSVMFDKDTMIVSYDTERGEPRGKKKSETPVGDCVNCEICVQVCPTGIDIRDGLQYECISCAACIDGCNEIMDKLGRPRGLIRYTTENALEHKTVHWFRGRTIGYTLVLSVMIIAFSYNLLNRIPLEVDVIRDRNQLYRTLPDGSIENSYTLKLANKSQAAHEYTIQINDPTLTYDGPTSVTLESGALKSISVHVVEPNDSEPGVNRPVFFKVKSLSEAGVVVNKESRFIRPVPK